MAGCFLINFFSTRVVMCVRERHRGDLMPDWWKSENEIWWGKERERGRGRRMDGSMFSSPGDKQKLYVSFSSRTQSSIFPPCLSSHASLHLFLYPNLPILVSSIPLPYSSPHATSSLLLLSLLSLLQVLSRVLIKLNWCDARETVPPHWASIIPGDQSITGSHLIQQQTALRTYFLSLSIS